MLVDPRNTWRLVEERFNAETDPILRRNLGTILAHMKAEARDDLDGVLATVSADAVYYSYDKDVGPPSVFRGHDEITQFYGMLEAVCPVFEVNMDQCVVDKHQAVTAGPHKMVMYGHALQAQGVEVDDPDAWYLETGRTVIFWPFNEEGLITGETLYRTHLHTPAETARQKVDPNDIAKFEVV